MVSDDVRQYFHDLLSPWINVKDDGSLKDLILIVSLPTILIVIQALVIPNNWAFPVKTPSVIASRDLMLRAFTSSFVHEGVGLESGHLWSNIFGYFFLMSGIYPLSVLAGWRRKLLTTSVVYLLTIPFIASQATTILPYNNLSLGFSGLLGALLGFVPPVLFAATNQYSKSDFSPAWAIVFVLGTFPVAFFFGPRILPILPLLWDLIFQWTGLFVLSLLLMWYFVGLWPFCKMVNPRGNTVLFWGSVVAVLGFMGLFVALSEANVVAHFAGYYVGFFMVFTPIAGYDTAKYLRAKKDEVQDLMNSDSRNRLITSEILAVGAAILLVIVLLAVSAIGYLWLNWTSSDVRLLLLGLGTLASTLLVAVYVLTLIQNRRERKKRQVRPLYSDLIEHVFKTGIEQIETNQNTFRGGSVGWYSNIGGEVRLLKQELQEDYGAWQRFLDEYEESHQKVQEHDNLLIDLRKKTDECEDILVREVDKYIRENDIDDPNGQLASQFATYLMNDVLLEGPNVHSTHNPEWTENREELREVRKRALGERYSEFEELVLEYVALCEGVRKKLVKARNQIREEYWID